MNDKKQSIAQRLNNWVNILSGQGTTSDARQWAFYSALIQPIPDRQLEAAFHNSDLARTIVERIVLDALKKEPIFRIVPQNDEGNFDTLSTEGQVPAVYVQSWDIINKVADGCIWGRLFGKGGLLLGIDDEKDLSEPFTGEVELGSLKWIETVDKRNLVPLSFYSADENPTKAGQPKTYQVYFDDNVGHGGAVVHESRFILFGGARTTDRTRVLNYHCDLSVLQDKWDILRDVDQNWYSTNQVIQDASVSVFKFKDLDQIMSAAPDQLQNRVRHVDRSKRQGKTVIIDADTEDYFHVGAENVSGFETINQKALERLAAAARMPVTILMGQSPAGMNATGESDFRNWYDQVESFQKDELMGPLTQLMTIVCKSEGILTDGEELIVQFPSLWEMSEEQKADLMLKKAQTVEILIRNGIVTPDDVREWFESK
jgi:uncharacterized protein